MIVSLPAVGVLGAIVVVLVRKAGLKAGHALACILLGFYLAGSSAAPTISDFTRSVADMLGHVRV